MNVGVRPTLEDAGGLTVEVGAASSVFPCRIHRGCIPQAGEMRMCGWERLASSRGAGDALTVQHPLEAHPMAINVGAWLTPEESSGFIVELSIWVRPRLAVNLRSLN